MTGDESLPNWLQRQIARREWTQADFARRLDLSTSVVSRWFTGQRVPDPAYCDRIADALGVDVDTVLSLAGHRPKDTGSRASDIYDQLAQRARAARLSQRRIMELEGYVDLFEKWDREGDTQ